MEVALNDALDAFPGPLVPLHYHWRMYIEL